MAKKVILKEKAAPVLPVLPVETPGTQGPKFKCPMCTVMIHYIQDGGYGKLYEHNDSHAKRCGASGTLVRLREPTR